MNNIIITFEDGSKKEYRKGIRLGDIIDDVSYGREIICARMDNIMLNHDDPIVKSGKLILYDIDSSYGNRMYEKGLTFLFEVCADELLGKDRGVRVRHTVDRGIFFEIDNGGITNEELKKLKELMQTKIDKKIPFIRVETTMDEAIAYFKSIKRYDKVKTLFYDKNNYVTLYRFEDTYDYVVGSVPHNSSIIKRFDLTLVEGKGVILRYPSIYDGGKIIKYTHHAKFFNCIDEYLALAKKLGISSMGELNDAIVSSRPGELINLSESMQDYSLQQIAAQISEQKDNIKFVLISGPSSSGKTTSSRKLALYLKTMGLNPVPISLDDYFLEREDTPLNENGKPDFESLRAIDVKLFNNQMNKLLKGNKVTAPTFDFIEGKKIFNKHLQMGEQDILIIEGLHALSNELLKEIPAKKKFKIYVSPLVYLNIDDDTRINLTDIRLLRRMVRDNRTRGYSPSKTLSGWSEVRNGEEQYVFPYQDNADVIFNTFLAYELAVLKIFAEPLLYQVKEDDPEYLSAIRLIKLLDLVLPLPADDVPALSILREFIGKGYFE